jgi:hypothetical protein
MVYVWLVVYGAEVVKRGQRKLVAHLTQVA